MQEQLLDAINLQELLHIHLTSQARWKHLEIVLPKAETLLGLWIRAVLAAPPSSLFSVSFSLPISPSPQWRGFKKENSKPCLKAICGRRWAQLWTLIFYFLFFFLLENLRCAGGFSVCLSICVCIKTSLCCWWGGREGIWGVSAWSVMWFFSPTFSTMKAEALHKREWKMLQ